MCIANHLDVRASAQRWLDPYATDQDMPNVATLGYTEDKLALLAGGKPSALAEHSIHRAASNSRQHVCIRDTSNISLARVAYILPERTLRK